MSNRSGNSHNTPHSRSVAIILAGGRSRRLSSPPKWQRPLGDRSLLEHIVARIQPQVDDIAINTEAASTHSPLKTEHLTEPLNRLDTALNLTVAPNISIVPDTEPGFQGPLMGLLTALSWAKKNGYSQVLTLACDMPFFPKDIYSTLSTACLSSKSKAAIVSNHQQCYAVLGLWSTELLEPLKRYIVNNRSINDWAATVGAKKVTIDDSRALMNINTMADLALAQSQLRFHL